MADRRTPSGTVLAACRALLDAAGRVPIVKRQDKEPFSTCLGCGRTDSDPCKDGCWVFDLDVARGRAATAIVEALK